MNLSNIEHTKLNGGYPRGYFTPFDLIYFPEFLNQVCCDIRPKLEKAGIMYKYDIPRETGYAYTLINIQQMSRVFYILAENVINSNPAGTSVYINMSIKPDGIIISFKDNGIGISSELADSITKSFTSNKMSHAPLTSAPVKNLDIVQKTIRDHGGIITLISGINKGCSYQIIIPNE